ncbi:MAG: peptidylprolyl isomerase [Aestuariibacter sp.]
MSRYQGILISFILSLSFATQAASDGSQIQQDNLYPRVRMETTMGNLVVELDRNRAPITVNNFLRYVDKGSYDGTIFHRVVNGFVVQGGGYDKDFRTLPTFGQIYNESGNGLQNDIYTIAMAREDDPHSATRQFYFNVTDNESLNPGRRWGYTVFGLVLEGAEVIDKISAVETEYNMQMGWQSVPIEPVMLNKVELLPPPQITSVE